MRKLQNIYPFFFKKSQRVSFNNVFFLNILLYVHKQWDLHVMVLKQTPLRYY